MSAGDVATLVVALGTLALAGVTYRQVGLSRAALDLSIRPFLADPQPSPQESEPEKVTFGAPGRISVDVAPGALCYQGEGTGAFHLSVAFENIGAGAAAITGAQTDPAFHGDVRVTRRFVPVGATVRVNVSVMTSMDGAERFHDQWWATGGLSVLISYTDADGRQPLTTKALISQAATHAPYVKEIAILREGDSAPIAVGRGD